MSFFRKLFVLFMLAAFAMVVLFFSQANKESVSVDFLLWKSPDISVWFLTFVSFLAGSLFTIVILFFDVLRVNVHVGRLRKENRLLKEELSSLRNQDIEDVDPDHDLTPVRKEELKKEQTKEETEGNE